MNFNVNHGVVKMLELIDKSDTLIWKLIGLALVLSVAIFTYRLPDLITAIRWW
ncbi:hypothetical protein CRENPOLYSF1_830018 [Crenothrix polyspora]|uniref:Uncharacterized protein n=1 Tax=Crenothrix polyspora TaxID=360316 RepID=A0A1R4HIG7_9GAMM|nr:hypothetical protein CRENPOLYSF1_830018 [Crenothrix polyspora]